MTNITLYHGCNNNRKQEFLENNFGVSKGDRHWLGDGIYFFDDDIESYKWIQKMYKQREKKFATTFDNLFEKYSIVIHNLNPDNKVLNLIDNNDHIAKFNHTKKLYMQRKQKVKHKNLEFNDGIIINFMFSGAIIKESYDIVKAQFKDNYFQNNSRFIFPERLHNQYCVKNTNVLTSKILIKTINLDCFNEYQKVLGYTSSAYNKQRKNLYLKEVRNES